MFEILIVSLIQVLFIYDGIAIYIFINEMVEYQKIKKKDKSFKELVESRGKTTEYILYLSILNSAILWPFNFQIIPRIK